MANANPFLQEFNLKFSAVPFDKIELDHYAEALEAGLKEQEEDIQKIVENTEEPTFENTIVALEQSGKLLDRVSSAFFNILSAELHQVNYHRHCMFIF